LAGQHRLPELAVKKIDLENHFFFGRGGGKFTFNNNFKHIHDTVLPQNWQHIFDPIAA